MPAYTVQFSTTRGPLRSVFTLDGERPLGPQLHQVLEELRQRGSVIAGGPGDELVVEWDGRELDLRQTPAALGVTPSRDLVLRMRPAAPAAEPPVPAPTAVRRRPRRFTRGAFAAPMTGVAGALLAWAAASAVRDLGSLVPAYTRLDLVAATILGAFAGGFVLGGAALRTQTPRLAAALLGLLLGAGGGAAGALAGGASAELASSFPLQRIVAWGVLGACVATAVALRWVRRDPIRLAEAAVCGVAGGCAAGAVFSLSGPGDFWQALAFALVGAATGFGACSLAVRRAGGVVELEGTAGRAPGLLRHREWEVAEGARLRIHSGGRGEWAQVVVAREAGRTWAAPADGGEAVRIAGRMTTTPVQLMDAEAIDLGGSRFRYRDFAGAA